MRKEHAGFMITRLLRGIAVSMGGEALALCTLIMRKPVLIMKRRLSDVGSIKNKKK